MKVRAGAVVELAEQGEAVRLRHRQRAYEQLIDDAEDGGVGADAEREGEDGHGGEAGMLEQLADGEA